MGIFSCQAQQLAPRLLDIDNKLGEVMVNLTQLDSSIKGLDLQLRTALAKASEALTARNKKIEELENRVRELSKTDEEGQAVIDGLAREVSGMGEALSNFVGHIE